MNFQVPACAAEGSRTCDPLIKSESFAENRPSYRVQPGVRLPELYEFSVLLSLTMR
jgi:hypothetical protein